MTSKGTLFLWIALLLIQSSSQSQNYRRYRGRARHNNGLKSYGSYYSGASYSLSKPVFSPYTTHSSERSTSEPFAQNLKLFPGGTAKRTVYTGRYCAYPTTRRVPHRVKNGTQTFLKRVVSQCAWSSLYCNPQVRYVVASRSSYRIQMKEIRRDEWRCCPGFSGPNCEQACFNCTTTAELSDKIDQLSRQISLATRTENDRSPTNDSFSFGDLRGPEGPPGPMGLKGQRGPPGSVGAKGDIGAIGPRGFPGIAGPSGIKGNPGAEGSPGLNGSPGRNGQKGEPGIAGPEGIAGHRGEKGNTGSPGQKGDLGPVGPVGLSGQPGVQGPIGPQGPKGSPGRRGITGLQGPPGSPGVCQCDSGPAISADLPVTEDLGSTSCVHEGITRRNEELWKSSNCRECTCLEGTVECFRIDCAPTSCQYTYTPVGYCCPVCCPDQGFNSNEYASGDGSTETLSYSDDESSNTTTVFPGYYSYEDEEVETTRTVHPTVRLDEKGCPLSSVTTRASAQPKSNEDAVCMLPKDAGPCRARIPKIYFDSSAMRCRPFTYGGCEGNANNFDSPQACRRMCVPQADAPRRVLSDDVRPRRPRRCNLAKARGSCRAYMPRFYYDRKEGRCRLFIFSGCSGNGNKFLTPHACRDVCGGSTPVMGNEQARPRPRKKRKPANCYLPKVRGPCRAAHSRFYYNHATKKCQIFLYGGCGGNDNNFELPNQCQQTCGGVPSFEYERIVEERRPRVNARAPRVSKDAGCTQPMDSGPCKGSFYRYFFNSRTTKCSVFLYGGCRGNGNNFETPEQCQKMCGSDGFNFTLTLKSDMIDTPLPQTKSRSRGKRGRPGPPGPRGPPGIGVQGPPGPQGPPGQMPSAFPDAAEINSIKATIESLKSRIVFLETNFLNNQIPAEDDEGTENVPPFASPEDLINTDQSSEQPESKDASKESPARRGDASDEELTYYYN